MEKTLQYYLQHFSGEVSMGADKRTLIGLLTKPIYERTRTFDKLEKETKEMSKSKAEKHIIGYCLQNFTPQEQESAITELVEYLYYEAKESSTNLNKLQAMLSICEDFERYANDMLEYNIKVTDPLDWMI